LALAELSTHGLAAREDQTIDTNRIVGSKRITHVRAALEVALTGGVYGRARHTFESFRTIVVLATLFLVRAGVPWVFARNAVVAIAIEARHADLLSSFTLQTSAHHFRSFANTERAATLLYALEAARGITLGRVGAALATLFGAARELVTRRAQPKHGPELAARQISIGIRAAYGRQARVAAFV
jgi:hypothetical protein